MRPPFELRSIYGLVAALIGALGAGMVGFIFLALVGVSTPLSWATVLLGFGSAATGPLLLLVGGTMLLLNAKPTAGARIALFGATICTAWVLWFVGLALFQAAHPSSNPAIDNSLHKIDAALYGALVLVAALADWAAFRASRTTGRGQH